MQPLIAMGASKSAGPLSGGYSLHGQSVNNSHRSNESYKYVMINIKSFTQYLP